MKSRAKSGGGNRGPPRRPRSRSPRDRYRDDQRNHRDHSPGPQQRPPPNFSPRDQNQNQSFTGRRYDTSDSYRPGPSPSRRESYTDEYPHDRSQPGRYAPRYPPPAAPLSSGQDNFQAQPLYSPSASDTYRPEYRPPRSDFNFSVPAPSGINFHVPPPGFRGGSNRRQDTVNSRQQRRPFARPPISARPILSVNSAVQPHVLLRDENDGVTYKGLADLSDNDDRPMSISGESAHGDSEPASKRRRKDGPVAAAPDLDVPKWSNPDQFAALAPEANADRRNTGKQVIDLIRKARVEAAAAGAAVVAEPEDIISFDSDIASTSSRSSVPRHSRPPGRGDPRSLHSLGSRKRTADDKIKESNVPRAHRKMSQHLDDCRYDVLETWKSQDKGRRTPCPWVQANQDSSPCPSDMTSR